MYGYSRVRSEWVVRVSTRPKNSRQRFYRRDTISVYAGSQRRAIETAVERLNTEGLRCLWCVDAVRTEAERG